MNWIKRALISLSRRSGKNTILLLMVFLLGNVMAGAVSVRQAIQSTQTSFYQSIPAIATIFLESGTYSEFNFEELGEKWKYDVPQQVLEQAAALPYVDFYHYSLSTRVYSSTLKLCQHPTLKDLAGTVPSGNFAVVTLRGGQDPNLFDIREGSIRLVEGRIFTQEEINSQSYVTLISKDLAENNNLTVGSKVTLENLVFYLYTGGNGTENEYFSYENVFAKQTMEFTIIGLFEMVEKQPVSRSEYETIMEEMEYYQKMNQFYVTNPVVSAQATFFIDETNRIYPEAVSMFSLVDRIFFVMRDATYLDEFREEVEPMIADRPLVINDTAGLLEEVIAPMRTFDWIASLVLYAAMGATVLTLGLLVLLFLRDRKYEIGIYRSLGEKRRKVIGQILLEVAAVAFVGITLSLFSGNLLSGALSERMLTDQVTEYESQKIEEEFFDGLRNRGYNIDVTLDSLVESYAQAYDASLDKTTVLLFYAVGMGTVALSSFLPVLYILLLKPKKTLL